MSNFLQKLGEAVTAANNAREEATDLLVNRGCERGTAEAIVKHAITGKDPSVENGDRSKG